MQPAVQSVLVLKKKEKKLALHIVVYKIMLTNLISFNLQNNTGREVLLLPHFSDEKTEALRS